MMTIRLYRAFTTVAGPLFDLILHRRLGRGKEDPLRVAERRGQAGLPRPPGRLLWVHAASVGESLAVLPLINRIRTEFEDARVLITTGTVTSARLLATRLPSGVVHQFVPVDRPCAWRRFLDHWRPDGVLAVESELWPNMIVEISRRRIPMALVNARMSSRSYARWRRFGGSARMLLGAFELVLAQSAADAGRYRDLGAGRVEAPGNLKRAAPPLEADPIALEALREAIGGRPCWLAASTHAGEEGPLLEVHRALLGAFPGALLILVPRHPERGEEVARLASAAGLEPGLRSKGELPEVATRVYVADTLGELGLGFRVAMLAFIGKSLIPEGGQNPLEAARLGCPPLYGPNMDNFAEIAALLEARGGAIRVADCRALEHEVVRLMGDPIASAALADRARAAAESEVEVLDATLAWLRPMLARTLGPGVDAAA